MINLIVVKHKSNHKIIPFEDCVTKFHCVFAKEASNEKKNDKRGFMLGINMEQLFIPVEEDVTLEYKWWALLKDIGFKYLPDFNNFDPLTNAL